MLQLKNIYKTYSSKNGVTHRALENVTLKFAEKGLVFILGKSGSGKSTLLNLIGGIDNYDRGDIIFYDKNFSAFKEEDYDYYRNSCVGFVFQDFNLLNNLTVFENVALALDLQSKKDDEQILDLLDKMGVGHLKNRMVNELSGGQKQRVAIARALIKNPKIILADEPTGALDSETSDEIIKILKRLALDRLVIVVTHNKELAYEHGDRIIEIRDGFVLKDLLRKNHTEVKDEHSSTLVSSNLVIVPKGSKISQENIDDLNVTISEKRQNYYLLIESNKNRAMSLYPNVSEVINDENNDETFVPYHHKQELTKAIKKIKSKYPVSKSIKFAFSGMKRKKLKLFLSILLAIFSVVLTGSAVNFTNYSLSTAVGESISKDNGNQLEVSSSFAVNDESYKLQNVDLTYLQSLGKEVAYIYEQQLKYQYDVSYTSNDVDDNLAKDNLFLDKSFYGFLVCDNIEDFGFSSKNFKVIYEMENLTDEDYNTGVYISSIVAETIVRYNIYDTKKSHDYTHISKLVGEKISVSNSFYKVLGIYDIDENESMYNKFKTLHDDTSNYLLYNEYLNAAKSTLLRLVVKPQFIDTFKENCRYLKVKSLTSDINNIHDVNAEFVKSMESISFSKENTEIHFYNNEWNESNYEEKLKNMKPNQILVSTAFFRTLTGKYYSESNKDEMRDLINSYNKRKHTLTIENNRTGSTGREIYQAMESIEIIGVVVKNPGDSSTVRRIYISGNSYRGLLDNYYRANRALIKMEPSDDYAKVVQTLYDNGFTIDNEFVKYFLDFASAIEQYSTLINIGVVIWFVIVGMLLYSFMASSIKDSSKEIGILKALGASMKDIYKIFIVEAAFIGIFALLFGIVGYYFVGLVVNNIVTYLFYTFYFTIFTFDITSVIVMILSIVLILTISLIIPMSKISNIKPIDVMNYDK